MGFRRKTIKAFKLRKQIKVFIGVVRDPRTPLPGKLLLGSAVGYLMLPIDIIPDFIPFIGFLDDVVIVPLLFYIAFRAIPKELIDEYRTKNTDS